LTLKLARQVFTLLIACTLVLAPVAGALAFIHPGESGQPTTHEHCSKSLSADSHTPGPDDAAAGQTSDRQSDNRCCELPCGQCGHCPGASLNNKHTDGHESQSASLTPFPGAHAAHIPERALRPPKSL
jgi:uncharacterized protein involved in copper resistance